VDLFGKSVDILIQTKKQAYAVFNDGPVHSSKLIQYDIAAYNLLIGKGIRVIRVRGQNVCNILPIM